MKNLVFAITVAFIVQTLFTFTILSRLEKFENKGKRFTYCDGVLLYVQFYGEINMPDECNVDTDFSDWLKMNEQVIHNQSVFDTGRVFQFDTGGVPK